MWPWTRIRRSLSAPEAIVCAPARPTIPLAFHFDAIKPPPRLILRLSERRPIVVPDPPAGIDTGPTDRPFDLSAAIERVCVDIARKVPQLHHIDPTRMLFGITRAKGGGRHGLQARITPLRFEGGELIGRSRGRRITNQRYFVNGREMYYIVAFCLPRFLNRDFPLKLMTIVHELYHVSPEFNGDLRRYPGRNFAHSHSHKEFDAIIMKLVGEYLSAEADQQACAFLRLSFGQLCRRHGGIVGVHLAKPKLIPVAIDPGQRGEY